MRQSQPTKIEHLRREYLDRPFNENEVPRDPLPLFELWFNEACDAEILEPNAMSLATASSNGSVSCRTVLLKSYGPNGFIFFTNYESEKSHQIKSNPNVALLFPWLALSRQVEIIGRAEKISTAESFAYFVKRPFKSRVGAWVSNQSSIISSRKLLESNFKTMCRKFANGKVPLPNAWGGFRVVPSSIEFWQGGASRLHDRIQYTKDNEAWTINRLAP